MSCSLGGYPKCWILGYCQKRGKQKEMLVLADLWGRPDKAGVLKMYNEYALSEQLQ